MWLTAAESSTRKQDLDLCFNLSEQNAYLWRLSPEQAKRSPIFD